MTTKEAIEYLRSLNSLKITVSGEIGAGKSTFTKHLALKLDAPRVYIGGLMREEAKRRGLTLNEFNKMLEKDDTIDRQMDELQHKKSLQVKKGVFEGRTSWYFVNQPDVRVFFSVDPDTAAERVWKDSSRLRDKYGSVQELKQANQKRRKNEIKRYQTYYGIDVYNPSNFDIVIDTSDKNIDQTFETAATQIAEFIKQRRA